MVGIPGNSGAQARNHVIFYCCLFHAPPSHLPNEEPSFINSISLTLSCCSHTTNAPFMLFCLPSGCIAKCLRSSRHYSISIFPNNRAFSPHPLAQKSSMFFTAYKIKSKSFPLTKDSVHHFAPICLIRRRTGIKCPSLCRKLCTHYFYFIHNWNGS